MKTFNKVITNENLKLLSEHLKVQDYTSHAWKTRKQWEENNFVPIDNAEESKIFCYLPEISENEVSLHKNLNGQFVTKTKPSYLSLFHESQVREKKIPNIRDIDSYEDYEFYNRDDRTFCTITNVIVTYENHQQDMFNVEVWHPLVSSVDYSKITGKQIMLNILEEVIETIGFKENQFIDSKGNKYGYAEDLIKISTCTHWLDKLRTHHQRKIKEVIEQTSGKFCFQPDIRCEFSNALIEKDSRIASEVKSLEKWLKEVA